MGVASCAGPGARDGHHGGGAGRGREASGGGRGHSIEAALVEAHTFAALHDESPLATAMPALLCGPISRRIARS
jgi:hypothetical protein